jgi:DNA-binding CsgD family transcriptional regulator
MSLYAIDTDSLRTALKSANDRKAIHIQVLLAEEYLKQNADSSNYFANLLLSRDDLTADAELRAVLVKSKVLYRRDSIQKARVYLLQSERIIEDVADTWYLLNYRMIRAYISELSADFDDAINQNQMGLELALAERDTAYLARFRNNLGLAYKAIGQYPDAVAQLKLAVPLFQALGQTAYANAVLLNIGATYIDIARYDSAKVYLERSSLFFKQNQSYYELASFYGNVANIAYLEDNPKHAIGLLHKKLTYLNLAEAAATRPTILLKLGAFKDLARAHLALDQKDSAKWYYNKLYSIAQGEILLEYMTTASEGLSRILEERGLLDSALYYYKAYVSHRDSLQSQEGREKALQMKADFELSQILAQEKRTIELKEIEKRQLVLIYTIVVLVLLALLLVVYAALQRTRKKQRERELAELTLKAEKRKLEHDMALKDKELTKKQVKLSESESRIESVLKELKEGLANIPGENQNILRSLAKRMEGRSTKNAMQALDYYLQESDTRLFEALSRKHPDLTRSELRLCAFIRLNLSSKEIATVMHQNANSLKMARYRMRKKMGLDTNENLVAYLNNLVGENT